MDWRDFVESLSIASKKLAGGSRTVYGPDGFATRDRYRHVVEKVAKAEPPVRGEVAERAIWPLRHEGATRKATTIELRMWVFYLIDKGLRELERTAATRLFASEA